MSTNAIEAGHLMAFIERIERLEEDEKTVKDEKKDVYAELKGCGYDVKIVRKIIARRKQDQDKVREEEEILELYLQALGMLADTPLGRAAVDRDFSRRVVERAAKGMGEPTDLTDDERAKGYSAAFKRKDGTRVSIKAGSAPKRVSTTVEERVRSRLLAAA